MKMQRQGLEKRAEAGTHESAIPQMLSLRHYTARQVRDLIKQAARI